MREKPTGLGTTSLQRPVAYGHRSNAMSGFWRHTDARAPDSPRCTGSNKEHGGSDVRPSLWFRIPKWW